MQEEDVLKGQGMGWKKRVEWGGVEKKDKGLRSGQDFYYLISLFQATLYIPTTTPMPPVTLFFVVYLSSPILLLWLSEGFYYFTTPSQASSYTLTAPTKPFSVAPTTTSFFLSIYLFFLVFNIKTSTTNQLSPKPLYMLQLPLLYLFLLLPLLVGLRLSVFIFFSPSCSCH